MRFSSLSLALALFACADPPPPPAQLSQAQVDEIDALLRQARTAARTHDELVRSAVARAAVVPGDAPCGVHLATLDALDPVTQAPLSTTQTVAARHASGFVGPPGAPVTELSGPTLQSIDALSVWETRRTLPIYGGDTEHVMREARSTIHADVPEHELVLVGRTLVIPHVEPGTDTFTPGALEGRLFMLDAEAHVLCVADVAVASGGMVEAHTAALDASLALDLIARGVLAGYPALHAAVPAAGD